MAYDNNIQPGRPPLLWSEIKLAFDKINENFTLIGSAIARNTPVNIAHVELSNPVRIVTTTNHDFDVAQQATISDTGVSQLDNNTYYLKVIDAKEVSLYTDEALTSPVNGGSMDAYASGGGEIQGLSEFADLDFTQLTTDIIPNSTEIYSLGDEEHQWKAIFASGRVGDGDGDDSHGVWLGTAQIEGVDGVINLPEGSTVGGELIQNPEYTFFKEVQVDNDQVVVANEFVDSINLLSGDAISMIVDSAAESITINNTGVTSATASTGIDVDVSTGDITITNTGVTSVTNTTTLPSGLTAGSGITTSAGTGGITLTNTGVLTCTAGFGITVSTTTNDGNVEIAFNPAVAAAAAFRTFYVNGTNPAVDSIVADSTADIFNFQEGYGITLTPDAALDQLTIDFDQNVDIIGSVFADDSTKLVDGVEGLIVGPVETSIVRATEVIGLFTGDVTGDVTGDLTGNVTGNTTGYHTGDVMGSVFAQDSSLMVDAIDNKMAANSFEGNILTHNIDSADSAAITVIPATVFNSDVTVENDLTVRDNLIVENLTVTKNLSDKYVVTGDNDVDAIAGQKYMGTNTNPGNLTFPALPEAGDWFEFFNANVVDGDTWTLTDDFYLDGVLQTSYSLDAGKAFKFIYTGTYWYGTQLNNI